MTDAMLRSKKGCMAARFIFAKGADFEWVIMEYSKDTMQLSVFYQIKEARTWWELQSHRWAERVEDR